MTLVRFATISALSLAVALSGCGDDDPSPSETDAGEEDAGEEEDAGVDPETLIDAGEPAEIPDTDSAECMDADETPYTEYDVAETQNCPMDAVDPDTGEKIEPCPCWSQSDPEKEGNCATFYCNWTEDQVLCQMKRPLGACYTEADLELGCDSTLQDSVAKCARAAQEMALFDDTIDTVALTKSCAREEMDRVVSPSCLNCYVESATCARDNCLADCLAGDTKKCDQCREDAGCTPAFFECTGFPDPQKMNPDGSAR